MPTPLIVISFDRLETLRRSIDSYRRLEDARIVIHDTGSTFPPLLAYLAELQRTGEAEVLLNRPPIASADDLASVRDTVDRMVRAFEATHYVVTDPDIELDPACPPDLLDFYAHLLSTVPDAHVVGPMLRIDDLPQHYPLRRRVIARQSTLFWCKATSRIRWRDAPVEFQRSVIDTTFGMYRSSRPFARMTEGLRTYEPYWARHLDWYVDPENLLADQEWYLRTCSSASHWGGTWLRQWMTKRVGRSTAVRTD